MRFRRFQRFAIALVAAGLGACGSIGDGVSIETLILSASRTAGSTEDGDFRAVVYQCVPTQLRLDALFTNGARNASDNPFTSRATWSSSDETVVRVSNRDIQVPGAEDGRVFNAGTLIAESPGTARVTARFAGLEEVIDVEVRPLSAADLSIEPTTVTMAPGSFQPFQLKAQLNGDEPEALTSFVDWQFESANDDVALISVLGVVSAVGASPDPLVVAPSLPVCPENGGPQALPTAQLRVQLPNRLRIESEFDGPVDAGQTLKRVNGTNETFKAIAVFENGDEQDLTAFTVNREDSDTGTRPLVEWTSSDTGVGIFVNNLLTLPAGSPGTLEVTAGYRPENQATASPVSDAFSVESIDGVITALRLIPDPVPDPPLADGEKLKIRSLGELFFVTEADFDTAQGVITQSITRHTNFSVSDASLLFVDSAAFRNAAGQSVKRVVSIQRVTEPDVTVDLTGTALFGGATASDTVSIEVLRTECSDETDNDADGLVDLDDPGCSSALDLGEADS